MTTTARCPTRRAATVGAAIPTHRRAPRTLTIFTIVLENHDYAEIVGSTNAPYINSLIAMGALATNYKDTAHPSLPNYLHMISGDNQYPGIVDVDPTQFPYFPANKPNLGTQLEAAGIKWRSYQESMGTPCKLTDSGNYAPKHDPFLYFTDLQTGANALCAERTSTTASSRPTSRRTSIATCGSRRTSSPMATTRTTIRSAALHDRRDTWLSTRCRRSSRATASRPAASCSSRGRGRGPQRRRIASR